MEKMLKDEGNETVTTCNVLKIRASNKYISQATNPKDFEASKEVAQQGIYVAIIGLKEWESKTGKR